jgi:hypothetical protein
MEADDGSEVAHRAGLMRSMAATSHNELFLR